MNHDLFPGLANRIMNADPELMAADLNKVEETLLRFKQIHKHMDMAPSSDPSARKVKHQKTEAAPAPAPAPSPSPAPADASYPFPLQR